MKEPRASRTAWAQLYEARRMPVSTESRTPGRPPAPIPRHKIGVTLSQAELAEMAVWQKRFSELLGRKVAVGETLGILTRICSTRIARSAHIQASRTLNELVERMVETE